MFSKQTYTERRQVLIQSIEKGILLFLGNNESPRNYTDNTYPFRQDSNFLYFFGIDRANLAATIDVESGESILFGDELTLDHIVWMGPQASIADQAASIGVGQTAALNNLSDYLSKAQQQNRPIHFLPPYRAENKIFLSTLLKTSIKAIEQGASIPFVKAVIALASIKTLEEIQELEKAVTISGKMHVAAMKMAKPGIREAELAGAIEGIALAEGGGLAYPAILTVNGQTLHNHYHGNDLKSGQLVLGDFGAETEMRYSGDITRTFPVDPAFTNQQKEIYSIVLDMMEASFGALKPGVRYLDVHLLAAKTMATQLKELGLMQGDVEEAVAAGAYALFFPHGLGHMLGLDVHDMEDLGEDLVGYTDTLKRSAQFGLKSLRLARALEAGFVLTVEPGIYFIPELIAQWQAEQKFANFINYEKVSQYLNFSGIRIEDDVLITENGYRILGEAIPKTIAEVEAIRNT